MERALQMAVLDFSNAERHPAVRAAIHSRADHAGRIPPENHFLAQPGDPDGLSSNFARFQYDVPLIADHFNILLVFHFRCRTGWEGQLLIPMPTSHQTG